MRIVGIFIIILMAFNAVASAHVDICRTSTDSCKYSIKDCDETSPEQSTKQNSSYSEDTQHNHCNSQCFHQCVYFQSHSDLMFGFVETSGVQPYSFSFTQTFLEGPFRPPLV